MVRSLHTEAYRTLTEVLIEARRTQHLNQQQLADALGKPQSYVAKVEGGERRLDVIEFIALARALGIEPMKLFSNIMDATARL